MSDGPEKDSDAEAKEADAKNADADADAKNADADADAKNADADADAKNADADETDAVFEALWKRVLEAWDDDKPHAAILQHAITAQMLPDLAGRYRALKDDPDKGARATKKIDGIVVAATQMLMATKSPAPTKTPWQWTATAAVVFLIVIAYLLYAIVLRRR